MSQSSIYTGEYFDSKNALKFKKMTHIKKNFTNKNKFLLFLKSYQYFYLFLVKITKFIYSYRQNKVHIMFSNFFLVFVLYAYRFWFIKLITKYLWLCQTLYNKQNNTYKFILSFFTYYKFYYKNLFGMSKKKKINLTIVKNH